MTATPPDRDALIGQLLDQFGVEDPGLREILATSFAGHAGATETPQSTARERRLARSLQRSEKIKAALMAKIEMLACALGACPSCWGHDPGCEDCGGNGAPGDLVPDPQCFETFVAPLLDQLEDPPGPALGPNPSARLRPRPRPRPSKVPALGNAKDVTPTKETES